MWSAGTRSPTSSQGPCSATDPTRHPAQPTQAWPWASPAVTRAVAPVLGTIKMPARTQNHCSPVWWTQHPAIRGTREGRRPGLLPTSRAQWAGGGRKRPWPCSHKDLVEVSRAGSADRRGARVGAKGTEEGDRAAEDRTWMKEAEHPTTSLPLWHGWTGGKRL